MDHHRAARTLVRPGAFLLTVSFALVGCSQGTDSAAEGPITSRMNALYGQGIGEDEQRADGRRFEEIVAACMKEKGFEYTPVPTGDDTPDGTSDDGWDPVTYAEKNGYGITPASKDALVEQYSLDEAEEEPGSSFADDDPNRAYYQSLSATDQAAYDEALHGASDMEGDGWTATGCSGEAYHEVYELPRMEDQETQPDSAVMDDFYAYADDKVAHDPRMDEADASWVSCMADKGFAFADRDEPPTSFRQRFDDLTGSGSTSGEGTEPDLSLFSDQELAALRADEIATATADAQCYVSSDVEGVRATVWSDAETEFYSSHKTEVDAYFAAQEAWLNQQK